LAFFGLRQALCAIKLAAARGQFGLAEGIETAISAMILFGVPV